MFLYFNVVSYLFQNKVVNVDGTKVKLQVSLFRFPFLKILQYNSVYSQLMELTQFCVLNDSSFCFRIELSYLLFYNRRKININSLLLVSIIHNTKYA